MIELKLTKELTDKGVTNWTLFVDGKEREMDFRTSRELTGTTNESGNGIFTFQNHTTRSTIIYGDYEHSNNVVSLSSYERMKSVQSKLEEIVEVIQEARAFVAECQLKVRKETAIVSIAE